MFRFAVFSAVTFCVAYLLYVFPVLALISLFLGGPVHGPWALPATAIVFVLLRLYLATSTTNRFLKAFVYYGMGTGFLAGMTLSVLLLAKEIGNLDGRLVGIVALLAIVGLTAIAIRNGNGLVIRNLSLSSDSINRPLRLAFISDVHVGSNPPSHLQQICHRLMEMEFDALLIGGDLFDSSDFKLEDISALKQIPQEVYFVTGNHEGYVRGYETQLAHFSDIGIHVLDNNAIDLRGINLIGVCDEQPVAERARAVDRLHQSGRFNLAMVHQPSIWLQTDSMVDLTLCGHTHNGQIYPFNFLVRLQFRHVYGLFAAGASRLYVSSGAGCWGPRMRLGSRNEIVMIDLHPS